MQWVLYKQNYDPVSTQIIAVCETRDDALVVQRAYCQADADACNKLRDIAYKHGQSFGAHKDASDFTTRYHVQQVETKQ